ncbi:MAG: hypothetical protein AAF533_13055 [Acidobacteriota bacterium]
MWRVVLVGMTMLLTLALLTREHERARVLGARPLKAPPAPGMTSAERMSLDPSDFFADRDRLVLHVKRPTRVGDLLRARGLMRPDLLPSLSIDPSGRKVDASSMLEPGDELIVILTPRVREHS